MNDKPCYEQNGLTTVGGNPVKIYENIPGQKYCLLGAFFDNSLKIWYPHSWQINGETVNETLWIVNLKRCFWITDSLCFNSLKDAENYLKCRYNDNKQRKIFKALEV